MSIDSKNLYNLKKLTLNPDERLLNPDERLLNPDERLLEHKEYVPLIYNDNVDVSNFKNILLIDSSVSEKQIFYDSVNSDTYPIIYSYDSKLSDLEEVFKKFSTFERISFVFHDNISRGKIFVNNELFFVDSDLTNFESFSSNVNFLINTIKTYSVKNVDFLACNSLNYSNWVNYYELLKTKTGVVVGASNDKTGNLKYGNDWVLENTNEDILNTYFTNNILNYTSSLSTTQIENAGMIYIKQGSTNDSIQYSNNNQGPWVVISFPATIINTNPFSVLTVRFETDLTITDNKYFEIGSGNITIDGNFKNVTITNVSNYPGLIRNGTSGINGKHDITIKNINTRISGSSTLATYGGGGYVKVTLVMVL